MTARDEPFQVAAVAAAAQAGEASAWSELISRFQDVAVGLAVGHGHWDDADDVAQEAFTLAIRNLESLADPQAFPAWFAALVRTASSRRRRSNRPTVPLGDVDLAVRGVTDHDDGLVRHEVAEAVRAAVESLPAHERAVITLHYLGGLPHRQVAEFLDISEAATKKRAWSARSRLKELLPMVTDALAAARPSRNQQFRDTVLLFAAIRDGDLSTVAAIIASNPTLVHATEDWTFEEGVVSQLGHAAKATPLVRAVGRGHLDIVRLLVEAGAPVNDLCECAGSESPLWTAASFGGTEIVDYLLERGADPNAPAFAGATPLHAAVQSGHHHLVQRLLDAGADPERTDGRGRTASDWAAVATGRRAAPAGSDFVETGIRAVDLLAPLRRGALVHLPPAYGLGQAVLLFQIADHLQPIQFWHIGFEYGAHAGWHVEHGSRETGVPVIARLVPTTHDAATRRQTFLDITSEVLRDDGPKLVVCQQAPGHVHDVTLALPALAAAETVLATFVTEPFTGTYPEIPEAIPEGFDARIAFTRARAAAGLWPAVDPATTETRHWPNERHADLSGSARSLLASYEAVDPALSMPDPATLPDPTEARRAQLLLRYLAQPIRVAELATSTPGERTTYTDMLDEVARILTTS